MNYAFPVIDHIDQVRNAIKGRIGFYESVRDDIIIFNYMFNTPDTFPDVTNEDEAILRECRGLIFSAETGNIIARRPQKFFNLNEKPETSVNNIDFSKPHYVLEKLDGSMITPIPMDDGNIRWGTKMGFTDVADHAVNFIDQNTRYYEFAQCLINDNYTPIFEFCSRKQRIVVDHPVDRLVLIAIRHNVTGDYIEYEQMFSAADTYDIEVVKAFDSISDISAFIEHTRNITDNEGYVVRFHDGHMLKLKSDWYVQIHRAKEAINLEKNVLVSIVDGTIDDLKPILQDNDRKRLEKYESIVCGSINHLAQEIDTNLTTLPVALSGDRKRFAIEYAANMDNVSRSIMFKLWDNADKIDDRYSLIYSMIVDNIRNACKTIAGVDKVRFAIGNVKWSDIYA